MSLVTYSGYPFVPVGQYRVYAHKALLLGHSQEQGEGQDSSQHFRNKAEALPLHSLTPLTTVS